MNKRVLTLLPALALIAALSACGGNPSAPAGPESTEPPASESSKISVSEEPAEALTPEPADESAPDNIQPSTGSGNTPAPTELSDSNIAAETIEKLTPDPQYMQSLFMTYGEQKAAFGANQPEFEVNSQYYVLADDVIYDFRAKDWTISDSDLCYRIEAKLNKLVPDLSEPMDLDTFVKTLHSESYDAYYEIHDDGHLDRNAIADRYASVYFGGDDGSGKEGSGFGAMIRVALPSGEDMVYPDAWACISITAG